MVSLENDMKLLWKTQISGLSNRHQIKYSIKPNCISKWSIYLKPTRFAEDVVDISVKWGYNEFSYFDKDWQGSVFPNH